MKDDTVRRLEALVLEIDELDTSIEPTQVEQERAEGHTAAA
ncbi:hypothetical protein ACQEVB_01090 [Pseudonocardia sp. CA-107938]